VEASGWVNSRPKREHSIWPANFFEKNHFVNLPPADHLHTMPIAEMKEQNSTTLRIRLSKVG
jgi:hypothetical protein